MKAMGIVTTAAFVTVTLTSPAFSQGKGIDRLYILECGQGHTGDMSRRTPGQNVNVPKDIVDNCYLIKHAQGYLLWDTGVSSSVMNDATRQVWGCLRKQKDQRVRFTDQGKMPVVALEYRNMPPLRLPCSPGNELDCLQYLHNLHALLRVRLLAPLRLNAVVERLCNRRARQETRSKPLEALSPS